MSRMVYASSRFGPGGEHKFIALSRANYVRGFPLSNSITVRNCFTLIYYCCAGRGVW